MGQVGQQGDAGHGGSELAFTPGAVALFIAAAALALVEGTFRSCLLYTSNKTTEAEQKKHLTGNMGF